MKKLVEFDLKNINRVSISHYFYEDFYHKQGQSFNMFHSPGGTRTYPPAWISQQSISLLRQRANARNVSYTPYPTGEKHTFVDQTRIQLTRQRRENSFLKKK